MKGATIYYPRLDARFVICSSEYTDLVRLLAELRGCLVEDMCELEEFGEFKDED